MKISDLKTYRKSISLHRAHKSQHSNHSEPGGQNNNRNEGESIESTGPTSSTSLQQNIGGHDNIVSGGNIVHRDAHITHDNSVNSSVNIVISSSILVYFGTSRHFFKKGTVKYHLSVKKTKIITKARPALNKN